MDFLKLIDSKLTIPYLIHITCMYSKLAALQIFKKNKYDITPEQYGILYILTKKDGLYQRQLSQILLKDRPNVTRMLDILEGKDFVYKKSDPNNRRITKVFITDDGKKLVEEIHPVLAKSHEKTIAGLTQDDLDTLNTLLSKIRSNLEENYSLQI